MFLSLNDTPKGANRKKNVFPWRIWATKPSFGSSEGLCDNQLRGSVACKSIENSVCSCASEKISLGSE